MKDGFEKYRMYALVTGAAGGMGRMYAEQLALSGYSLMIADINSAGLEETRRSVTEKIADSDPEGSSAFNVIVVVQDLSEPGAAQKIFRRAEEEGCVVDVLVNNAGTGGSKRFGEVPLKYVDTIVQLNVAATVILTHELLPNLRRNTQAFILNISSMAGIIPTGYKTVYPASKAFIKNFSLGLREELKQDGISVSFAVLGPMPTKPEIISRINRQGLIGRSLSVPPEKVARICVAKMFRKRRVIVPGKLNSLSFHLVKVVPEYLRGKMMSRSVRKHEL